MKKEEQTGGRSMITDLENGCTGYLVYLFQKSGREQPYQKNIIMCLVSEEQRTGTVRALFELFF